MKLKKYSHYKNSGIDWIGDIPKEWEIRKIKNIGKISTSSVDKKSDPSEKSIKLLNYMDIYNSKEITNDINFMKVTIKPSQYVNSNLKVGDLLFTPSSETVDDIGHSAVIIEELKGVVYSYHILRLRFNNNENINLDYKKYIFNNYYFLNQLSSKATGTTRMTLGLHDFKDSSFVLPPIQTQQRISSFLDSKTSQIENLIEKDKNLIELLKERRVSLINKAVTKGLDDSVKMKDSGVEWIGEIPESWEVRKLSQCFDLIGSGTTPTSGDDLYHAGGTVNWLLTGDLNDGYITETSKKVTIKAMRDYSALKLHPENSLVIAMYGATIGKIGLTKIKTTMNQACCVLNKSKIFKIKFIFYWFLSKKKEIISLSYGGGQPNISQDIVKYLKIQTPSIKEQEKIIEFLDKKTVKIDDHIKKVEKRIEFYKEYKKTVIYNVVTGKVEV